VTDPTAEELAFACCTECLGTGELYPHSERDDNGDCPVCEGSGMVEMEGETEELDVELAENFARMQWYPHEQEYHAAICVRRDLARLRAPAASVGGYWVEGTINDLARAAQVCIAEEQAKASPDNHYIAVFCNTVRLCRESNRLARSGLRIESVRAPAAGAPSEAVAGLGCFDCGRKYSLGPDLVVPNEDFARIAPNPPDGGVLCPNCMHDRFVKLLGGSSYAAGGIRAVFTSGPFAETEEQRAERERALDTLERELWAKDEFERDIRALLDDCVPGLPAMSAMDVFHAIGGFVAGLRGELAEKTARVAELETRLAASSAMATARLEALESQLAARPALEWLTPEEAPRDGAPMLLVDYDERDGSAVYGVFQNWKQSLQFWEYALPIMPEITPEDMREACAELRARFASHDKRPWEELTADQCREAFYAHETEEQRAERLLGAWLVAHPGWTHGVEGKSEDSGPWSYRIELWRPDNGVRPEDGFPPTEWHESKAAAIREALAKADGKVSDD
jgi:hypothetical protein